MIKTTLKVAKMDCPCEENLIKLKLGNLSKIHQMSADIEKREFYIFHDENEAEIVKSVASLGLDSTLLSSEENAKIESQNHKNDKKLLYQVLIINFILFILEMGYGIISNSMGLISDSLDMLSDSIVYAMALFVIGAGILAQKRVAMLAGVFQLTLAILGLYEVINRFYNPAEAINFKLMMIVSFFALIANALCLVLLNRSQSEQAHMKASKIFTSNDIVINLGVILAGVLVYLLNSNLPDLIVATIVFIIVARGAFKIISLSR